MTVEPMFNPETVRAYAEALKAFCESRRLTPTEAAAVLGHMDTLRHMIAQYVMVQDASLAPVEKN